MPPNTNIDIFVDKNDGNVIGVQGTVYGDVYIHISKEAEGGLNALDNRPEDQKEWYNLLAEGLAAYREKVIKLNNQMQIFEQPEPKVLTDIYINVHILEKLSRWRAVPLEELKQVLKDTRILWDIGETKQDIAVINTYRKLTILGKPGAGKTTLLKRIMLYAIQGQLEKHVIPIFIELKDWFDKECSLLEYIALQFDICGFPDPEEFIEWMLQHGKCIILFDGYDQISELSRIMVSELRDFIDKYDKNRFVLSCRIAAYHHTFVGFRLVELGDFTEDQIEQFIDQWFSLDPKLKEEFWEKLNENNSMKELASTPLLLTLLCIQFDNTLSFPPNRANLYRESLNALLIKRNGDSLDNPSSNSWDLHVVEKIKLLSYVAERTFQLNENVIPQLVLEARIIEYFQQLYSEDIHIDSLKILKAIEADHGLLVELAASTYRFSHLILHEYFTALYIVEHQGEEELIHKHLFNSKWREVILLTVSMQTNKAKADSLLRLIRNSISRFASKEELTSVLHLAYKTISPDTPYSQAVSRALSLEYILFQARARDLDLAPDSVRDLALALARALDQDLPRDPAEVRKLALDMNLTEVLAWDLLENITQDRTRNLPRALDRDRSLSIYLASNILLIECLQSGSYFSREVATELTEGLLLEG